MPWPGPLRPNVNTRMSDQELDALDQAARAEGIYKPNGDPNRSETIRRATAIGLAVLQRWPGASPATVANLDWA